MRRESKRNCPFCDAKGVVNGELCDVCKGVKKIVIRYDKGETEIDDIKVYDNVCEVIKEEIRGNNNG